MKVSGSKYVQHTAQAAADAIKKSIEDAPDMSDEEKGRAKKAIETAEFSPAEVPNTPVYWIAVSAVGAICLIIVLGTFYLATDDKETPNFLQMALATAIGALAGMVVPTSRAAV